MRTLTLVLVVAMTVPAMGALYELPLVNSSFEQPLVAAGNTTHNDTTSNITGWEKGSNTYIYGGFDDNTSQYAYSNLFSESIPDGNQFAQLRYTSSDLYQVTPHQVEVGETYSLHFSFGESYVYEDMRSAPTSTALTAALYLVEDFDLGMSGTRYNALAHNTLAATAGTWSDVDWGTYTGDAAHEGWYLTAYFWHHDDGSPWYNAFAVDDVKIVSSIPEPATMALLAVGGLGMLRRRRSRQV
jgi:hypothetical protein